MRVYMQKIRSPFVLVLTMLLAVSCGPDPNIGVRYTGALNTIMSGDLEATISLDTLSQKKNLYALGAEKDLKGEIQVFEGEAFISRKDNGNIKVSNSFEVQAALLVYAQVDDWEVYPVPPSISTMDDLEMFVFETAKIYGLDTEKPFPFLVEGELERLEWHVIDWPENDTVHNHQKHREAGASGNLDTTLVDVLGFYSALHKGVFTHHTTQMHMHFKTRDGSLAGHVDKLVLGNKMTLKLQGL